jgi:hypothetical protein
MHPRVGVQPVRVGPEVLRKITPRTKEPIMSANSKEIYRKGYTYVITRRIIQRKTSTVLRVRVVAYKGVIAYGQPVMNEYRDYISFAEGDIIYARHIKKIENV